MPHVSSGIMMTEKREYFLRHLAEDVLLLLNPLAIMEIMLKYLHLPKYRFYEMFAMGYGRVTVSYNVYGYWSFDENSTEGLYDFLAEEYERNQQNDKCPAVQWKR